MKNIFLKSVLACVSVIAFNTQVYAAKVNICAVSVERFPTDNDSLKWYEKEPERYVDEFIKTQRVTQAAANCYAEKMLERFGAAAGRGSQDSIVELNKRFTKLLFQEKKVKGMLGRMVDNKNQLPDQAHIDSIKENMTALKEQIETEIQTYRDNTRRLALSAKRKLTAAERTELADLEPKASRFLSLSASDIADRNEKIQLVADFITRVDGLNAGTAESGGS